MHLNVCSRCNKQISFPGQTYSIWHVQELPASCKLSHLLLISSSSLDPNQTRKNIRLDMDPFVCLFVWFDSLRPSQHFFSYVGTVVSHTKKWLKIATVFEKLKPVLFEIIALDLVDVVWGSGWEVPTSLIVKIPIIYFYCLQWFTVYISFMNEMSCDHV